MMKFNKKIIKIGGETKKRVSDLGELYLSRYPDIVPSIKFRIEIDRSKVDTTFTDGNPIFYNADNVHMDGENQLMWQHNAQAAEISIKTSVRNKQ